eukprot:TRINITY_DN10846_c0_g1_i5.p1 TRINITY_DN10846_c0_g1~~TRINITY_DN10846_c0_g1_i5.p1  ORF type:complete len:323 (-),score=35.34 TRINITY_DN10846_c0_g1_i5:665-1633(-)
MCIRDRYNCLVVSPEECIPSGKLDSTKICGLHYSVNNINQPIYHSHGFCPFPYVKETVRINELVYDSSDFCLFPMLEEDLDSLLRLRQFSHVENNYNYINEKTENIPAESRRDGEAKRVEIIKERNAQEPEDDNGGEEIKSEWVKKKNIPEQEVARSGVARSGSSGEAMNGKHELEGGDHTHSQKEESEVKELPGKQAKKKIKFTKNKPKTAKKLKENKMLVKGYKNGKEIQDNKKLNGRFPQAARVIKNPSKRSAEKMYKEVAEADDSLHPEPSYRSVSQQSNNTEKLPAIKSQRQSKLFLKRNTLNATPDQLVSNVACKP